MKTLPQLLLLTALAVVLGSGWNQWNASNPEKHLRWVNSDLYADPYLTGAATPAQKAPAPAPTPTSPAGQELTPPAGKAPTPPAPQPSAPAKQGGEPPPPAPAAPAGHEAPAASGEFNMIPLAEALASLESGVVFIDARRTRDYEAGHIPTALSMSAWESDLQDKIARLVSEGAVLEAPVVVYCGNSKECEDSKIVSRQLRAAGFQNLLIYQGGFPEWEKEKPGLVARGKEPGVFAPPPK